MSITLGLQCFILRTAGTMVLFQQQQFWVIHSLNSAKTLTGLLGVFGQFL